MVLVALAMAGAVVATGALVRWDEKREEDAAFEDLALEQSRLSRAVAAGVQARLEYARRVASLEGDHVPSDGSFFEVRDRAEPSGEGARRATASGPTTLTFEVARGAGRSRDVVVSLPALLDQVSTIERPGEVVLLVHPPGEARLLTVDGREAATTHVDEALETSAASIRLDRAEATALGLPARAAFAGLSRFDAGSFGHWSIAVVASASRERTRESRSRLRLVATSVSAGALVFLLGWLNLRRREKEADFAKELALVELQRRLDERLVRANRVAMMGTFATGVAHEISTPLGVIVGKAEILESKLKDDERGVKATRAILEQADRIRGVVRGFLNLARGGDPVKERLDPADLVRSATNLVQHRFEKAGVSLSAEPGEVRPPIFCDKRLLEHALVNLLLNACQACERGGHVTVEIGQAQDRVEIVVKDDGTGIAEEDAARAIEPFFTTKSADQGTGLGLAITNEIVKAHRGALRIEPNEPIGTKVTISVPSVVERSEK
jgi:signal transduction histidine kinase